MRIADVGWATLMALFAHVAPAADDPERSAAAASQGIDLMELLEMSAERLKKRFIVDPRARGQVLMINVDPKRITYAELQAILNVHGLLATQEIEGTVRIVPEANSRQVPMPLLKQGANNLGDEEMVMRMLEVGSLNAADLVPVLRPMLPQYAHLVAHQETNTLIVVGRQANVRMIESIVRDLRARPTVAPNIEAAPK